MTVPSVFKINGLPDAMFPDATNSLLTPTLEYDAKDDGYELNTVEPVAERLMAEPVELSSIVSLVSVLLENVPIPDSQFTPSTSVTV